MKTQVRPRFLCKLTHGEINVVELIESIGGEIHARTTTDLSSPLD